ncbi:lipoyl domain-containing protein [Rubrivirga sp. IMCC43871]|uniref:lipoyl domain-containing protein n=1 Tax=Rubrivirga sp. IMCC43871 TaxID=3391575 RepID=UPI00398FE460
MPDPVVVAIPATLWESDGTEEVVLSAWLVADGATVEAGAPLAELMVDKVTVEIEAPAGGRLQILTPADAPVGLGTAIARIHPA